MTNAKKRSDEVVADWDDDVTPSVNSVTSLGTPTPRKRTAEEVLAEWDDFDPTPVNGVTTPHTPPKPYLSEEDMQNMRDAHRNADVGGETFAIWMDRQFPNGWITDYTPVNSATSTSNSATSTSNSVTRKRTRVTLTYEQRVGIMNLHKQGFTPTEIAAFMRTHTPHTTITADTVRARIKKGDVSPDRVITPAMFAGRVEINTEYD